MVEYSNIVPGDASLDIAANETPTERQSTATILRNGVANVVKVCLVS